MLRLGQRGTTLGDCVLLIATGTCNDEEAASEARCRVRGWSSAVVWHVKQLPPLSPQVDTWTIMPVALTLARRMTPVQ